ncbi:MAG: hypothetical protein KC431_30650, partial [Myxococcales bacterium]|nr:hypothetical protein [Myxococcales bacterium]
EEDDEEDDGRAEGEEADEARDDADDDAAVDAPQNAGVRRISEPVPRMSAADSDVGPAAARSRKRTLVPLLALAFLAALVAAAVFDFRGREDQHVAPGVGAQVEDDAASPTPTSPPPTSGGEVEAQDGTTDEGADGPVEDRATEDGETGVERGSDGAGETGDGTGDGAGEAERIVAAIAAGELRALDLLLILELGEELSWRQASDRCRTANVHDVSGFRLPALAELRSIRGARMLGSGRYWTSTLAVNEGDGNDHVYVVGVGRRNPEAVAKDTAEITVLCVRDR